MRKKILLPMLIAFALTGCGTSLSRSAENKHEPTPSPTVVAATPAAEPRETSASDEFEDNPIDQFFAKTVEGQPPRSTDEMVKYEYIRAAAWEEEMNNCYELLKARAVNDAVRRFIEEDKSAIMAHIKGNANFEVLFTNSDAFGNAGGEFIMGTLTRVERVGLWADGYREKTMALFDQLRLIDIAPQFIFSEEKYTKKMSDIFSAANPPMDQDTDQYQAYADRITSGLSEFQSAITTMPDFAPETPLVIDNRTVTGLSAEGGQLTRFSTAEGNVVRYTLQLLGETGRVTINYYYFSDGLVYVQKLSMAYADGHFGTENRFDVLKYALESYVIDGENIIQIDEAQKSAKVVEGDIGLYSLAALEGYFDQGTDSDNGGTP